MPSFQYDKESNIMSIRFSPAKSVDSDVHKNIVIDYDRKGGVVNIDIMDVNIDDFVRVEQYAALHERQSQKRQSDRSSF